jgi:hypothetical protein
MGKGSREYRKNLGWYARCEKPTRRATGNWRAVCEETRTHGSEGGGRKRTGRDTTRNGFWQVEASSSTSSAPYPTSGVEQQSMETCLGKDMHLNGQETIRLTGKLARCLLETMPCEQKPSPAVMRKGQKSHKKTPPPEPSLLVGCFLVIRA